jgi:putative flippase GtrA
VFFVVYWLLTTSAGAAQTVAAVAAGCRCASPETVTLVVANVVAWMVAVSGSYVMNSNITFAAESGRQLRWRAYLVFVASGVLAMTASTTTLVLAARVMPVWAAKGVAILVSFVVNFSMSHFIVFRPRREAGDATSR